MQLTKTIQTAHTIKEKKKDKEPSVTVVRGTKLHEGPSWPVSLARELTGGHSLSRNICRTGCLSRGRITHWGDPGDNIISMAPQYGTVPWKVALLPTPTAFTAKIALTNLVIPITNITLKGLIPVPHLNTWLAAWRTLLVYRRVKPCLMHNSHSRKGTVFVPKHGKKTCKGTDLAHLRHS